MKIIPFALFAVLLVGCAGQPGTGQRVALDTLATGGGGAAAYFAGGHDPALTTAGAVGGFVVSEAFQAIARSGRQKAYNSGVEEGKAIGQQQVLQGLWEESNGLPKNRQKNDFRPVLIIPGRKQNGVRYDAHQTPCQTTRAEKILTNQPTITHAGTMGDPAVAVTNQTNRLHYETFQTSP